MDDSMARQYGSPIMAGRIRPGASPMTASEVMEATAPDARPAVPLVARLLGQARENNERLIGAVNELEALADRLFGAAPDDLRPTEVKSFPLCSLRDEWNEEGHKTNVILSNLERAVERLRMVA